jgi:hypothetical protein
MNAYYTLSLPIFQVVDGKELKKGKREKGGMCFAPADWLWYNLGP